MAIRCYALRDIRSFLACCNSLRIGTFNFRYIEAGNIITA